MIYNEHGDKVTVVEDKWVTIDMTRATFKEREIEISHIDIGAPVLTVDGDSLEVIDIQSRNSIKLSDGVYRDPKEIAFI